MGTIDIDSFVMVLFLFKNYENKLLMLTEVPTKFEIELCFLRDIPKFVKNVWLNAFL